MRGALQCRMCSAAIAGAGGSGAPGVLGALGMAVGQVARSSATSCCLHCARWTRPTLGSERITVRQVVALARRVCPAAACVISDLRLRANRTLHSRYVHHLELPRPPQLHHLASPPDSRGPALPPRKTPINARRRSGRRASWRPVHIVRSPRCYNALCRHCRCRRPIPRVTTAGAALDTALGRTQIHWSCCRLRRRHHVVVLQEWPMASEKDPGGR